MKITMFKNIRSQFDISDTKANLWLLYAIKYYTVSGKMFYTGVMNTICIHKNTRVEGLKYRYDIDSEME